MKLLFGLLFEYEFFAVSFFPFLFLFLCLRPKYLIISLSGKLETIHNLHARQENKVEVAKFLLEKGANVDQGVRGNTPLRLACRVCSFYVLLFLFLFVFFVQINEN